MVILSVEYAVAALAYEEKIVQNLFTGFLFPPSSTSKRQSNPDLVQHA